ncbi:MAG: helix-turn-helix domain-containing protein [Stappiaceae bacterium]
MFSIGIAAERSGVMIETIRYYEREGIVPKPGRSTSGRRIYTDDEIARLRFVKRCRDLGFAIPDAKSLLGLTDGSQDRCSSARTIAEKHLQSVQKKIRDLMQMEQSLADLVTRCSDDDEDCPIISELLSAPEQ